jgi:hypothetical protein
MITHRMEPVAVRPSVPSPVALDVHTLTASLAHGVWIGWGEWRKYLTEHNNNNNTTAMQSKCDDYGLSSRVAREESYLITWTQAVLG